MNLRAEGVSVLKGGTSRLTGSATTSVRDRRPDGFRRLIGLPSGLGQRACLRQVTEPHSPEHEFRVGSSPPEADLHLEA
jgi:hypothetical protein